MVTRRLSPCLITLISSLGLLASSTRANAQQERPIVMPRTAVIPVGEAAPEAPTESAAQAPAYPAAPTPNPPSNPPTAAPSSSSACQHATPAAVKPPAACPSISHENEQCPRCRKWWDDPTAIFCNPPDRWQIVEVSPTAPIPGPIPFFVPMAPVAPPEADPQPGNYACSPDCATPTVPHTCGHCHH
jgi:hypothetical protein